MTSVKRSKAGSQGNAEAPRPGEAAIGVSSGVLYALWLATKETTMKPLALIFLLLPVIALAQVSEYQECAEEGDSVNRAKALLTDTERFEDPGKNREDGRNNSAPHVFNHQLAIKAVVRRKYDSEDARSKG